jgi:Fur family transcriptional regulator, ferric uptake regulator
MSSSLQQEWGDKTSRRWGLYGYCDFLAIENGAHLGPYPVPARGADDPPRYHFVVGKNAPGKPAMGEAATLEDALELVRREGGRVTSSRRLLLHALFATTGHRTAEELASEVQAAAPDIHISTIYRNLDELERLGVIVHSHFGHGPATYHLATSVHGHFVCEECGRLIEVPETMFDGLATKARTRFGFTIDPHHFAMLGRCADCR